MELNLTVMKIQQANKNSTESIPSSVIEEVIREYVDSIEQIPITGLDLGYKSPLEDYE